MRKCPVMTWWQALISNNLSFAYHAHFFPFLFWNIFVKEYTGESDFMNVYFMIHLYNMWLRHVKKCYRLRKLHVVLEVSVEILFSFQCDKRYKHHLNIISFLLYHRLQLRSQSAPSLLKFFRNQIIFLFPVFV